MFEAYRQLLDASIQHLKGLKARGVRFVPVSAEVLARLTPAREAASRPAPGSQAAPAKPRPLATPMKTAPRPAPNPPLKPASPVPKPVPVAMAAPAPLELLPTTPPKRLALSPEAKAAAFADLQQRVLACVKCPNLMAARQNVVFGVGTVEAQLMFVGEAPGADEDAQGEPFVGKAGQLLTRIIQTMGLSRETVFIANILKCRPDTPGQTSGNRKPTPAEMQTCFPYLQEQIDIIQPKVLVALGATAMEGLLGKLPTGITRLRGHWLEFRGTPVMPTYHPAYLLRNQALSEKRRVWEDMLQVMEKLGLPISPKQRNYFLKGG